jgi:catechol 2,3-dioxygenase-like lactoylglutathione lyase family enzyme
MESEINKLVEQFETGGISRRGLIQGLTALAAIGAATEASAQAAPFESAGIDHISVQVEKLAPSIAFYQNVFGLTVLNEDVPNKIVRMGPKGGRTIVSLHEKGPTGIVDHYAIAIRNFDREQVTAALAKQGLTAQENLDYGYYVRDPAGIPVQIVGAR